MRRGRIRTLEFIVGGMLLGVLFDGLHRWLPSDWSDRYGSGVNQKQFENDLRTRRPGQATVKGLVIQPWRIRNPDGSEASFHIVISNHLDHLEYECGKPTPIWKRESFVAPIPFKSLDDRKTYPTVMAYLDSKATSAGPIPYQLAWWWIAPKSTAFWAAVGGVVDRSRLAAVH